jgi:hypothetical protein
MPKVVEDLVEKLLSQKDFYPEKSEKEQKAIAYAIAYKQYNKSKRKKKADTESIKQVLAIASYASKLELNNNYAEADELSKIVLDFLNDNSNNTQ